MGQIVQVPDNPCPFCRKNEATQLCDFVVDYIWTSLKDEHGRLSGATYVRCSNSICKQCATRIGGFDFCPDCVRLYEYIRENRVRRSV